MSKTVILFHSTNLAMWAGEELTNKGIPNKMISVPRNLSSNCGYCIQIDSSKKLDAKEILEEMKIEFEGIEDV